MKINDLIKKFEAVETKLSLDPPDIKLGPMGSAIAQFNGPQISVRLLSERNEPVVELSFGKSCDKEWFDLNIIQNCVLREDDLPVHSLDAQLSFLEQKIAVLKSIDFDKLKSNLKKWQKRRASQIFGIDL